MEKQAHIEWGGESEKSADEAMNGEKTTSRRQDGEQFLITCFRSKREWKSEDLFEAAKAKRISRDAIFEAKKTLGLPKAEKRNQEWVWSVPDDWPHLADEDGRS